jgi:hypothetical protein
MAVATQSGSASRCASGGRNLQPVERCGAFGGLVGGRCVVVEVDGLGLISERRQFEGNCLETGQLLGVDRLDESEAPDGHAYSDPGWSVSSVWCTCNGRHMRWRCWCGKAIYAPQPGPHCRLRDRGSVSMWEDEQRPIPEEGK